MIRSLLALLSGSIFGFGLALSGMIDPMRVRGFLDIFGAWDPTLAFVMGGATIVMAAAWLIQRRMHTPVACDEFSLPSTGLIDRKLLGGAALFGIGWGIAGLCPGPAIASLATNLIPAGIFVLSMLAGMLAYRVAERAT
ncbi:YeeE/YedE family protein [Pontixanthobacter aestiaquae]|uniref:YeeE/YedE family protein n=1 Tax=Pontixanthobacter aestiaquae TaxID=1509367 RepID=A0A844Z4G4_9SPHN|nr:DUF6691 family protein [Pontixanthobacter aestiaquae]MDN3646402.1 YeeE/YedE family protein [Pontixanthobacter aestiaquae]MXO82608.1 YeeE/YedE family protein [Pontixanthobacter aestiaquae]